MFNNPIQIVAAIAIIVVGLAFVWFIIRNWNRW